MKENAYHNLLFKKIYSGHLFLYTRAMYPNGYLGYFAFVYMRLGYDINMLRKVLDLTTFSHACMSNCWGTFSPDLSCNQKIAFLLAEIDRWRCAKCWPTTELAAVLAAIATVASAKPNTGNDAFNIIAVCLLVISILLLLLALIRHVCNQDIMMLEEGLRLLLCPDGISLERKASAGDEDNFYDSALYDDLGGKDVAEVHE